MYKGEFATVGKPIFKMANLDEMILRAYFTGDQLAKIKVGQTVKILVDAGNGETKELNGKLNGFLKNLNLHQNHTNQR